MPYIQKLINEKQMLKESYMNFKSIDDFYTDLDSNGTDLDSNGKDIVDLLEEFRASRLKESKSSSKN